MWIRGNAKRVSEFRLLPLALGVGSLTLFGFSLRAPVYDTAWRDTEIAKIFTPLARKDGQAIFSRQGMIARCRNLWISLPAEVKGIAHRAPSTPQTKDLHNFLSFVEAEARMGREPSATRAEGALGFMDSDRQYWESSSPYLVFPPLLAQTSFLSCLESPATYPDALKMIAAHNRMLPPEKRWTTLLYRSQFIRSVDQTSYGRLLIFIPDEVDADGSVTDRWIQFAIATPDLAATVHPVSVSMIAVRRQLPASPPMAYLADFFRTRNTGTGEIEFVPTMFAKRDPSTNCFDCHKSPVIALHPAETFAFDRAGRLSPMPTTVLDELNHRALGYRDVSLADMNQAAFGPSIGTANLDPAASTERIREAMKCGACHGQATPLNFPMPLATDADMDAFAQKQSLAKTYIEQGRMPPNNDLTAEERQILWKCLSKAYLDPDKGTGTFVDWLKGN